LASATRTVVGDLQVRAGAPQVQRDQALVVAPVLGQQHAAGEARGGQRRPGLHGLRGRVEAGDARGAGRPSKGRSSSKHEPLPGCGARQLDRAAHQLGQAAADRQSQARAAVPARHARVGLAEGHEEAAGELGREARAGVLDVDHEARLRVAPLLARGDRHHGRSR
jgi:hypothetical protein